MVVPVGAVVTLRPVLSSMTTGLWCPRCLLGTGVDLPVLVDSDTLDVAAVTHARFCMECGTYAVEDA